MEIVMIVLIGLGLAFDVFAIAVSQGSVLGNVKARGIVLMCLMVCVWQVVALTIGYLLAGLDGRSEERDTLLPLQHKIVHEAGNLDIVKLRIRK